MAHVPSIQILRAIAALMIVILHAGQDAVALGTRIGTPFAMPALPLAAGVDLFFVISGFVMVVSSQRLFGQEGKRWTFLGRRLARIAPIYWLMTGLFLAMLALRPEAVNSAAPTLGEIIKSLMFIPYVKPADGLMQPVFKLGWTLNYEMMFYLVFGLALVWPARKAVLAVSAVMAALVLIGLSAPLPGAPLTFWTQPIILEFVFGLWIGLARIEGLRLGAATAAMLTLAAGLWLCLAPTDLSGPAGLTRLVAWGIPSAMIIAAAALSRHETQGESRLVRALSALGDASYALYLCHPFAIRLTAMVFDRIGGAIPMAPLALLGVATALAITMALLLHALFERPVTQHMQSWLGVGSKRPLQPAATAA